MRDDIIDGEVTDLHPGTYSGKADVIVRSRRTGCSVPLIIVSLLIAVAFIPVVNWLKSFDPVSGIFFTFVLCVGLVILALITRAMSNKKEGRQETKEEFVGETLTQGGRIFPAFPLFAVLGVVAMAIMFLFIPLANVIGWVATGAVIVVLMVGGILVFGE